MNPVDTYLAKPTGERLYSEGLRLFHQYGLNAYPKAWQKLSPGPFGRNKEDLEGLLRRISAAGLADAAAFPPAPAQQITVHTIPPPPKKEDVADLEYGVLKDIRHKRQERMRHSQSFHDCKTDADRAMVCDAIQAVNDELARLDGELAYIRRYGKKPPEPEPETFIMPEDDKELAKMQNRRRSSILKVEKRIEFLEDLPEKDKRRAKLPAQFNKLRDLQTQVELIIQKRKQLKNAKRQNRS